MKLPAQLSAATLCTFVGAALTCAHGPLLGSPSAHPARSEEPARTTQLIIDETARTFGRGELIEPLAVAVDQRNNIYVADAMTGKVFRYTPGGKSLEFERSSAATALFPIDVDVEGSTVYILDYAENRVLRYDDKGMFLDILISFNQFGNIRPVSFTVGEGGRFFTTDVENHSLTFWTPLLEVEFSLGEYGWAEGSFDAPRKAASLPDGGIAVVEAGNRRIQILTQSGGHEGIVVPPDSIAFRSPRWIAADRAGNLFVADAEAGMLFIFSINGNLSMTIDSYDGEAISPTSVAIGWDNHLYVTDLRSKSVLVYRLHYR